MIRSAFLIIALGSVTLVSAAPEAYFDSDVLLQKRVVDHIRRAKKTIDIAVTDIQAPSIVQALQQAGARKVRIRILGDATLFKNRRPFQARAYTQLKLVKGQNTKDSLMGRRYALFDRAKVLTGVANWPSGTSKTNYDSILIEDNPTLIAGYLRRFDQAWGQKAATPPARKKKPARPRKKR